MYYKVKVYGIHGLNIDLMLIIGGKFKVHVILKQELQIPRHCLKP
jgi:hypothetical protein